MWGVGVVGLCGLFFFFKQKTAYEMRISDWSSDVCSSDLSQRERGPPLSAAHNPSPTPHWVTTYSPKARRTARATCRELRARASRAPVCPALTFTVTRTSRTGHAPPGAHCPPEVGTNHPAPHSPPPQACPGDTTHPHPPPA